MMGVSELGMEDLATDNLAEATEADLGGDGEVPTTEGLEMEEDKDLSRYDNDEDVQGYSVVTSGGEASMTMSHDDENVEMKDA